MRTKTKTLVALLFAAPAWAPGADTESFKVGKALIRSAGPLAFGPDGVLFAADSAGAAIFALDTNDRRASPAAGHLEISGIDGKIAALLGTAADRILIYDTAVNPLSKNVYLSVARGRGPDAEPVILRLDGAGKLSELSLDNIRYSSIALPDARSSERLEAITYIQFVDGNLIVAGLSNEEFSSNLRSIPFPFRSQAAAEGAGIEIYHTSHGLYETDAPVRTFVPFTIDGKAYILAAYTCTPLVKIAVSELKPGNKVTGDTIAELGAGNRPLDMIAYRKEGHDYILMANSSRGVVRLAADHLEAYQPMLSRGSRGVPRTKVMEWSRVHQLKKVDDATALILTDAGGTADLRMVPLP